MIGLSSLMLAVLSTVVITILLVIFFLIPFIFIILIISSTFLLIGTLITSAEDSISKAFKNEKGTRSHIRSIANMISEPLSFLHSVKEPGRRLSQPLDVSVANMILDDELSTGYQVNTISGQPVQNDMEFINNGESVQISQYIEDEGDFQVSYLSD